MFQHEILTESSEADTLLDSLNVVIATTDLVF
jgi:hypothetical protein